MCGAITRIICPARWSVSASVSQSFSLSDRLSPTSAVALKDTQQKEEEKERGRNQAGRGWVGGGGGLRGL